MKVGVVGHVEWVEFVELPRVPLPGEVAHGDKPFTRAAGGGGVAAVVLARLAETVEFFLSLGRDTVGEACEQELQARGVTVHVGWREQPTRRALTLLDAHGERTIITIGERLEPRGDDALDWSLLAGTSGVYVTAGDREAVRLAREAPVVVATPRARAALEDDALVLDALVYSAGDPDECAWAERVAARTRLLVATEGAVGGSWRGESEGRWVAAPPPGPPRDTYGCGDSFAAGITFGLASGLGIADAAALGARLGAAALAVAGAP